MTPPRDQSGRLARLLEGVPVVLVLTVLSAAAVVGIVRPPSFDLAATGTAPDRSVTGASDPASSTEIDVDLPPSELPIVGSYARATVRPDGDVEVVEWVRTARRTGSLTVRLPAGAPETTTATEVVVLTGDGTADGPSQVTSSASYLPAKSAKVFVLRYVLSGVARISPSSPTRALVRPITLATRTSGANGDAARGPRLLTVESSTVLALACSIPGNDIDLTPCGSQTDGEWRVELEPGRWSTLVAAQVELV